MIGCGHCGGEHATVAEVRACAMDDDTGASPGPRSETSHAETSRSEPPPHTEPRQPDRPRAPASNRGQTRSSPAAIAPVVLAPDWDRLAGPDALGRNIVVLPGAEVPGPWRDAQRVVVDDGPDGIAALQDARQARRRVAIELTIDLPEADPVLDVDFWHLSPETDLEGELLRHLVLAHAVDARDAAAPTIAAVSAAVAAGATVRTEGDGDVDTPAGPAWCDGGPLDWFDLGTGVIPAVHLSSGRLGATGHNSPSADLAPDQLAAVAHGGGGARIIAPAGSGKTRVLTERARHLVHDRGIDPSTICLLAFNVRAREEMEDRTRDIPGLEIRTLNSLALAIVSGRAPFSAGTGRSSPRVIDERDVRRILDDFVGGRRQAMSDPFATWIEALTSSRLGLRSPKAVEQEFAPDVTGFADVLPQYRERLRSAGAVDFDEQILGAIEVLCTDAPARATARRVCGVLLVDEFQDLTPAHVLLLRLLAGPAAEVFGVGDDDQTIYGYSGASPEWLIDFGDLFPGSGAHDLTINYRCPPAVVGAAATLLTHNRRRIDKTILAEPGREGGTADLTVAESADPLQVTVDGVRGLIDQGVAPRDIAVLTRVNATLLGPMLVLEEAGIRTNAPVHANFVERTGVAGALAWLELATSPAQRFSSAALETAIRRPPRGISQRLAGWAGEQRSIRDLRALANRMNNERDQSKIMAFADDLESIRAMADDGADTSVLLTAVRDDVGLGRALDDRLDASRRSVDRSAHGDDLSALLAVATHQPDPAQFGEWVRGRLAEVTADPGGVRLATIHRVKGREWPHVFVHEATAGLMPHRLASDREEERRVFHVAVTRGSQQVTVVAGVPASPFVPQLRTERNPDAAPEPELRPRVAPGAAPARAKKQKRAVPEASSLTEATLRERLKSWRSDRSKSDGVPAFVVFNDATMFELARLRPLDENALLDVSGVGPVKVEKYGEDILAIIEATLADA